MTRDQIDELMRENGIVVVGKAVYSLVQLVIEREREKCAAACQELLSMVSTGDEHMDGVADCIAAIRARGEK